MIPNSASMALLFGGFSTAFAKGMQNAPSRYAEIAMKVSSNARFNNYGWLGALPRIREWLGDRIIHNLSVHNYAITNRSFESTVSVERVDIEDDQYGIYGPIFEKLGADSATHPDELVFSLLAAGFGSRCYDGQNFFDADHPIGDGETATSVSNVQAGDKAPWFLLDCSQPIRPLLFQERLPYQMQRIDSDTDMNVFLKDKYLYGVRARCSAGYGLWQLAYASMAELTPANYETARSAMATMKNDSGKSLGIRPTHLIVPPSLEGAALRLLKATISGGESNEWADSAKLVVTPFLE